MKNFLLCLLTLSTAVALGAQELGYHDYRHPGYDTTPLVTREGYHVHQDERPLPPRVRVANSFDAHGAPAPSDATILFDGESTEQWRDHEWRVEDGNLIATKGGLITKSNYGDFQLHLEWRTPDPALASHTGNIGNSGLYIMGRYELQIYDSYSSRVYADGGAGAVYGQTPPLVNVTRKPHEWQTYDIIFHAPIFRNEELLRPAYITVLHNGVLIQNHTEVLGPTGHKTAQAYKAHAPMLPLTVQAHGSEVAFRNIWIREL